VSAYRDDRDTLLARIAELERAAEPAKIMRRRPRLWARAGAGEIVVLRRNGELRFLRPGGTTLAFGWIGVLPIARAPVRLDARGVPCRDGVLDVDLGCLVGIGDFHEAFEHAARHFVDAAPAALADAAAPLIERALRAACAPRRRTDDLTRIGDDTAVGAQSALRDLGLELGDVIVTAPGGIVTTR
jgi:hypothetical protein